MGENTPYCAEYAKSGISKCAPMRGGCGERIPMNELRFGDLLFESNGLYHWTWYCFDCFFQEHGPEVKSHLQIQNFDALRSRDQKRIEGYIGSYLRPTY